jgi:Zn-finger nucleic acid-binding protein
MHEIEIGTTAVLECDACHGTWIDAQTFERLCADREAQAAVLLQLTAGEHPAAETTVHYRKCVTCGTMMNRLNFSKISGTVIDVCKGHGTFLDAGELHQIVTFIRGGGLERARQRQIDDLHEQERARRSMLSQPSGHFAVGETTPIDGDVFDLIAFMRSLIH